jgi:hypothetical protein
MEEQFSGIRFDAVLNGDKKLFVQMAKTLALMVDALNRFTPPEFLEEAMEQVCNFPFAIPADSTHSKEWNDARARLVAAQKRFQKNSGKVCPPVPPLKGAASQLTIACIVQLLKLRKRGKKGIPLWKVCSRTISIYEKEVFAMLAEPAPWIERVSFEVLSPQMKSGAYTQGQQADWVKKAVREDFRTLKRVADRAAKGMRFAGKKPAK